LIALQGSASSIKTRRFAGRDRAERLSIKGIDTSVVIYRYGLVASKQRIREM
jgi:hypothetical protein